MGAHHFFTRPELVAEGWVRLDGEEAHHAAKVLRVREGERITVADGSGRVLDAVVTDVGEATVDSRVILERPVRERRPELVLVQGLVRRERMELVIQKSVEVGAARILPFMAERSVVRWDAAKRAKAEDRWRGIAKAAAKQARSPWLTEISSIADDAAGVDVGAAQLLVLHEEATDPLRASLPEEVPEAIGVVVGPEGGLTPAEVASFSTGGGRPVTLGDRILRTETAGPVALAILGYAFGLLG